MAPPRKRVVLRLLDFLVRHSAPASAALYMLGIFCMLAMPFAARNTYMDENALLAAAASPSFSYSQAGLAVAALDAAAGKAVTNGGEDAQRRALPCVCREGPRLTRRSNARRALRTWLLDELRGSGLRAEEHAFVVARRRRGPVATRRAGVNVVAAVRAQRGDGKETIVLVTPLRANSTLGLGVSLALARHLADVPWLSRDVLFLAADAECAGGAHAAAEAWLTDYHEVYSAFVPDIRSPPPTATFLRGGLLSAALVFDAPAEGFDAMELRMQGSQGALPNLDVVALLRTLAGTSVLLHEDDWDGVEGGHAHTREHLTASLRAAARFLRRQARAVPDGVHGAFLDAAVDAATIVAVRAPGGALPALRREDAALRLGQMLEGSVRSLSNLLERLHHSSAFYVMLSPERFLAAAVYMLPGGLMSAALLLSASGCAIRGAGTNWPEPPTLDDWTDAALAAVGAFGVSWAAGALLLHVALPMRDAKMASSSALCAAWVLVSSSMCVTGMVAPVALLPGTKPKLQGAWLALKAILLAAVSLLLAQGTIINTGLTLPCALVLAPACLAAQPAPRSAVLGLTGRAARAFRWGLVVIASPPVFAMLAAYDIGCAPEEVVWRLAETAAEWNTLAAPLLFGACLPSTLLCAAIMRA